MKKILITLGLVASLFLLTGCGNSHLQKISYNTLKDKISNKETFVLFVSRTGCSHCEAYEPNLIKVLRDYKIDIYKIDLAETSAANRQSVLNKVGSTGTPTLIYIKNGSADTSNSIIGESSYDNTKEFFENYDLIKE